MLSYANGVSVIYSQPEGFMILMRGFKSVISTSKGTVKEPMLFWHVVSNAKLLKRQTNAQLCALQTCTAPSMDTRKPEMIMMNLFLHSVTSKSINFKGITGTSKFNKTLKLKCRG